MIASKDSGCCGGDAGSCALMSPGAVFAITGRDSTPAR